MVKALHPGFYCFCDYRGRVILVMLLWLQCAVGWAVFFFYFTSAQIVLQAVLFHAKMPSSLLELFPLCTMSASGHASIIYDIDYIALSPRPNVHPGFLLVHFCRFEKWGVGPIYHKKNNTNNLKVIVTVKDHLPQIWRTVVSIWKKSEWYKCSGQWCWCELLLSHEPVLGEWR